MGRVGRTHTSSRGDEPVANHMVRGEVSGEIVEPLLEWARDRLRDLPWRRTRDPWCVLVSEVMSQQTGIDRVVPKYLAFIERFPTPDSCASAPWVRRSHCGADSVIRGGAATCTMRHE